MPISIDVEDADIVRVANETELRKSGRHFVIP
jgi:hypothetical protein